MDGNTNVARSRVSILAHALKEAAAGLRPPLHFRAAAVAASLCCIAAAAHAEVKISAAATSNMTCSDGICAPTAKDAVLNAGDLETMLASGNAEVTTTGSAVQAEDIRIDAPLSWSSTSTLSLDAYRSIRIEKPVTISGLSGLSLQTDDGGSGGFFAFGAKGHVTFANLSSALKVNGAAYTLEGDIKSLADAIAANSAGDYALANNYDASQDGTYQNSPIPTQFSGSFEGLGNTISNLSLNGTGDYNAPVGLFAELALNNQPGGAVENIKLEKLHIGGNGFVVGGLVGFNIGTVSGSSVRGSATSDRDGAIEMALLVGANFGTITRSGAVGVVATSRYGGIGGLSGSGGTNGTITQSYANAKVSGGPMSSLGGLTAASQGPISQSYAMGSVTDSSGSFVGGLVGANDSMIAQAYSTGAVARSTYRGGLIGYDGAPPGSITSSYWDTTTSHVRGLRHGAGTPRSDPGITGLTTTQLQSGLPAGFDPKVWAEDLNINGGFPYLIDNPPPQ